MGGLEAPRESIDHLGAQSSDRALGSLHERVVREQVDQCIEVAGSWREAWIEDGLGEGGAAATQ